MMLTMQNVLTIAIAFWRSESGATSIEYGVIGTIISCALIAGARTMGTNMNSLFYTKVQGGFT